ncbi:MAG: TCP-1/cpn60 chaperonin family protein [Halobacteriaceae archaeon]
MAVGNEGPGLGFGADADLADVRPEEWSVRDADARAYVREGTKGVAGLVRTTFGPRGMEKLVKTQDTKGDPEIVRTSDAGELLDAVERGQMFRHPVAAVLVDNVNSMQGGLGDGTSTAVLLTASLVDRGFDLIDEGLHPGHLVVGYAMAAGRAGETLDDLARPVDGDHETLRRVAATSMTADVPAARREQYADLVATAVQAVTADGGMVDTDEIGVKSRTDVEDRFYDGPIVRQVVRGGDEDEEYDADADLTATDRVFEDATVAIVDREVDFEETASSFGEQFESGVRLEAEDVAAYTTGLQRRIASAADAVADLGVDVFVAQNEIDDRFHAALERRDVLVVEQARYPRSDVYRLARATGGEVVPGPDDLTSDVLGRAGRVHQERHDDETWTVFDGCDGPAREIVARARTASEAALTERLVEDALQVTAVAAVDGQVLPGAGAPAAAVAADLRDYASTIPEKEQLAIEAFAGALEDLVGQLGQNAGADPLTAAADLRAAHANAGTRPASLGLSVEGDVVDAYETGVVEPRRVFSQAVETARAAAEHLTTVDAVLYPNVDLGTLTPRPERT